MTERNYRTKRGRNPVRLMPKIESMFDSRWETENATEIFLKLNPIETGRETERGRWREGRREDKYTKNI